LPSPRPEFCLNSPIKLAVLENISFPLLPPKPSLNYNLLLTLTLLKTPTCPFVKNVFQDLGITIWSLSIEEPLISTCLLFDKVVDLAKI
jgi:hypothetical protein